MDTVDRDEMGAVAVFGGDGTGTTLDEFLTMCREYMRTHSVPASTAVDAMREFAPTDPEEMWELIREGAAKRLADFDHRARSIAAVARPNGAPGPHLRDQLRVCRAALDGIILQAADGSMKPLRGFTLEDWTAFAVQAKQQAAGWRHRAAVAEEARKLLQHHEVECTRDLPMDVQDKLNARAEAAWKRA